MAARPFLTALKAASTLTRGKTWISVRATSNRAMPPLKPSSPRHFHSSAHTAAVSPAAAGQSQTEPIPEPYDTKNAAFLGEADSDDGFEAHNEINPRVVESLDAANSAYLGEADSDDGFVAHRDANPPVVEGLDASASAYLGEADSDDGFEGQKVLNPTDHGPIDPTPSAFHGQAGEQDH
jgi:hypothetical protein